jgi:hypothetical protein
MLSTKDFAQLGIRPRFGDHILDATNDFCVLCGATRIELEDNLIGPECRGMAILTEDLIPPDPSA